ncbi:probable iron binding protein from the HesB_IscA_SufA family [invertebrate metagenome]|uniref:Probable iron binding protein from the HesB_IscA_SufA family n=1 Tax=invertebrate metagenome TaxID=1711999 RepID=A0A484H600_9ZZZZ
MTTSAAQRVIALRMAEGNPALMLRLTVSGGGCSGFQYGFSLDAMATSTDHVFEHHGARLVVDHISLSLLQGARVDYVDELMGAMFVVQNPNAISTCGCGNSFSA